MITKKIIKIYCDNGADIKSLKKHSLPNSVEFKFFQYPYDPNSRGKKLKHILAKPSGHTWQDDNTTWEEDDFTWEDCTKSEKFDQIQNIIGKEHKQDILHLDSAYKTNVNIFITSDKQDIESNKKELESLLNMKIFFHKDIPKILEYSQNISIKNTE